MPRVLVIDDEEPIRLLCRVNLEAAGIEVREAEDGTVRAGGGARRAARRDPPRRDDAGDGRLAGLRGAPPGETHGEIPIVFLTARAELRDQARGLELGGVDYVTKPFNPLQLAPLIEDLLGADRARGGAGAQARAAGGAASGSGQRLRRRALAASEVGGDEAACEPPATPTPNRRKLAVEQVCRCGGLASHIRTSAAAGSGFVPDARFSPIYGARTPNRRRRWTKGPWSK